MPTTLWGNSDLSSTGPPLQGGARCRQGQQSGSGGAGGQVGGRWEAGGRAHLAGMLPGRSQGHPRPSPPKAPTCRRSRYLCSCWWRRSWYRTRLHQQRMLRPAVRAGRRRRRRSRPGSAVLATARLPAQLEVAGSHHPDMTLHVSREIYRRSASLQRDSGNQPAGDLGSARGPCGKARPGPAGRQAAGDSPHAGQAGPVPAARRPQTQAEAYMRRVAYLYGDVGDCAPQPATTTGSPVT